jgi:hypothetical protein
LSLKNLYFMYGRLLIMGCASIPRKCRINNSQSLRLRRHAS